jgi:hypothetical protein
MDLKNIYSNRVYKVNKTNINPASQYQTQKIIQNTVRVPQSLYLMNLASLTSYQHPWNQMSDRAKPSNYKGQLGVDVKNNSYNRYLNKLKGRSILKREQVPVNFGKQNIYEMTYGGKLFKTNIINGCDCFNSANTIEEQNKRIYNNNSMQQEVWDVSYKFNIGDYVSSKKNNIDPLCYKAQIINIIDNYMYVIEFEDGYQITTDINNISIYIDCSKCDSQNNNSLN